MSSITTLKSYLVSLGFDANMGQFHNNFEKPMHMASSLVKKETFSIATDILKWQTAIVGLFASISAATLTAMDKVSMADQEYRLFGERMFMDTNHARNLKIALDALGEPLEAIAFDPELHERFMQLQLDQKRMTAELGPDFEGNMRKMRDIRFEFTRLKVELEYLAMGATNSIFKALGLGSGDFLTNLRHINEWIITNIPYLSQQFSRYLVPILKDTKDLLGEVWNDIKLASIVFDNFIGILSSDKSIEGETASFEKFATAIEHVLHWLKELAHYIGQAESLFLHLMNGIELNAQGKYVESLKEFAKAGKDFNGGSGAVGGAVTGAAIGSVVPGVGTLGGAVIGGVAGGLAGKAKTLANGETSAPSWWENVKRGWGMDYESHNNIQQQAMMLARQVSKYTGIPANFIFDQWAHETNDFSNRGATSLNNLGGVRISGSTEYRKFSSLQAFADYFEQLLTSQRYTSKGILSAKTIPNYAEALKAGGYYADTVQNYTKGMLYREREHNTAASISVGNIYIMQPNATPQEIQHAVTKGVQDAQGKTVTRLLPQVQGAY